MIVLLLKKSLVYHKLKQQWRDEMQRFIFTIYILFCFFVVAKGGQEFTANEARLFEDGFKGRPALSQGEWDLFHPKAQEWVAELEKRKGAKTSLDPATDKGLIDQITRFDEAFERLLAHFMGLTQENVSTPGGWRIKRDAHQVKARELEEALGVLRQDLEQKNVKLERYNVAISALETARTTADQTMRKALDGVGKSVTHVIHADYTTLEETMKTEKRDLESVITALRGKIEVLDKRHQGWLPSSTVVYYKQTTSLFEAPHSESAVARAAEAVARRVTDAFYLLKLYPGSALDLPRLRSWQNNGVNPLFPFVVLNSDGKNVDATETDKLRKVLFTDDERASLLKLEALYDRVVKLRKLVPATTTAAAAAS